MGSLANKPVTNIIGWIIMSLIIVANLVLLFFTFTGRV